MSVRGYAAPSPIHVLLVEDDEDDYLLTRALLAAAEGASFELRRVRTVSEALEAIRARAPDVVLLGDRRGEDAGLDFLARLPLDPPAPVILLSGQEERAADIAAMEAGAADYLVRAEVTPGLLERSIRHAIEHARLQQELLLRDRAVEAISEGVLLTDPHQPDNPIIYANPAFERLTGYVADEVLGANCRFLQGPGTDPAVVAEVRAALAAERPITAELLNYRKDGTPFWNRLSISPVHDPSGKLTHFVGVQQDVTERKNAEDALRASAQSYRSLFASVTELLFVQDLDGRFLDVNRALLERYGYSRKELLGRTPEMLADPEWPGLGEALARIRRAATGEPQQLEWCARTKTGETFVTEVSLSRGEYFGEPVVIAVGRDVSERKRADAELRAAETHYRRLVTTSPQAIYALDLDGRFIELNPAGERLLDRSAAEVLGEPYPMVVDPEDRDAAEALFVRVMSGEVASATEEIRVRRRSGEPRLFRVTVAPIQIGGAVVGVHGIAEDITQEAAREERVRLLAGALESLQQGVSITDEEARFIYANAAHARILGYRPEEVAALDASAFVPAGEPSPDSLRLLEEGARRDGICNGRVRRRRISDGRVIDVDVTVSSVENDGRTLFFTLIQDAGETIAREQRLRRMERLASVGTTLGGVAHELNNPLSAIKGLVDLLLMNDRSEAEREDLEVIRREADRMAKIVSDLRIVARHTQEEARREVLDLNDIVRHVLKVREYALRTSNIEVRQDLAAHLPHVWGDRGQLEQVLLNLVVNAEQAMVEHRGKGLLIVRTRASRTGVTLQVFDDGPGIPPEHLDRIFDAFFTTKAPQEGTGLGLPLVHSIVADHGGDVLVDSEVGRGTTFRVDLPRAPSRGGEGDVRDAVPSDRQPVPLRVLVVDDEAAIRRTVARFLGGRGHRVDEAADGGAALGALRTVEYDVILSDLRMPGLAGRQLLERLREDAPEKEQRLIFMTGDIGSDAMKILAQTEVPLLEKPFELAVMARMVEERAARAAQG